MARIVAFLNFKGGVGKTANVVNIGACLAATHQKRVLIVDLDAQCNSSLWLLGKTRWKAHIHLGTRTVYRIFRDRLEGTRRFSFSDAVVRGVPFNEKDFGLIGNLDLLPAVVELMKIEDSLASTPRVRPDILANALRPVRDQYDYILLDCPPSFFGLSKNAVFCADQVVVPYIPDYLSVVGFRTLAQLIDNFGRNHFGTMRNYGAEKITTVVINRYQTVGNVFRQGLVELDRLTADLIREGLISPSLKRLDPPIRQCVKVAEAPAVHLPIVLHAPTSIGGIDYAALTSSFIQHIR